MQESSATIEKKQLSKKKRALRKPVYWFFINRIPCSVTLGSVTGEEIRRLGFVPADHILKFQIPGTINFIDIGDKDLIDLTREGAEHFISEQPEPRV
ncbi:MAG: multiubiquitin domain-containing protein [Cytophagaceae bacterium]